LGKRWPKPVHLKKCASLIIMLLLFWSAFLPYFLLHLKAVYGNKSAAMRPSKRPVFVGTTGDIEVNVTVPGRAVKIEIPREFVPVSAENDTSFVWSTITEDYWYYNVTDASQHFPYDPNAPWYVIIWSWNLTGFTPPQIVRFKNMVAPRLAGLYNVTIYVATSLSAARRPIFSETPDDILTILVCGSRDWATIYGYLKDAEVNSLIVKTKGIVYAVNVDTGERVARALVNVTTGYFNLTGLRPGRYFFEASAGYFPTTDFAYVVTDQRNWYPTPIPLAERQTMYLNMSVYRGARISGEIRYQDLLGNPIRSLDHPWLISLGYSAKGVLNWTVEAYDSKGKLTAIDFGNTTGLETDPFRLMVGKGRKYVGVDPVGTEFCGIGIETYTLTTQVFAYVQKYAVLPVQINQKGQDAFREIYLKTGGVISGTIRFVYPQVGPLVLETPREAEQRVLLTDTGKLFGGHVLVEAYRLPDWSLKGIFVLNGTGASGVTVYADKTSIRFYILGFSEYYNRTYSGVWRQKDYGLDEGSYNVKVHIRGYLQATNWNVTLGLGLNGTMAPTDMKAGGAIRTILTSGIAWRGTMRLQMTEKWIFLLEPIPYRARIYHYDEVGVSYGYVEVTIAPGQPGVQSTRLNATFTGMNYDLAEVIYWGEVPTVLPPGTYIVKAFTYGYVQSNWPKVYVEYHCALAAITMLIGGTVSAINVLTRADVFYGLVENVSFRVDVFDSSGVLSGGQIGNATVGKSSMNFTCHGFGGVGHFFFVTPDGVRHFDYGFGMGSYDLFLRRFGYLYRFEQTTVRFSFGILNEEVGYVWRVRLLNKIYGVVKGMSEELSLRLSWATISVVDLGEASMALDGTYWVFVPDGRSRVSCSLVGYITASTSTIEMTGGMEMEINFTLDTAPL